MSGDKLQAMLNYLSSLPQARVSKVTIDWQTQAEGLSATALKAIPDLQEPLPKIVVELS